MTTLITLGNWIDEKGVKKFTAPMLLKYLSEASDYAIQRKLRQHRTIPTGRKVHKSMV